MGQNCISKNLYIYWIILDCCWTKQECASLCPNTPGISWLCGKGTNGRHWCADGSAHWWLKSHGPGATVPTLWTSIFLGGPGTNGVPTFEHLVSTWLSFLGLIAGNMSGQYSLIARREGWQPPHRPLWIRIVFFTTNKGNKSVQSENYKKRSVQPQFSWHFIMTWLKWLCNYAYM